MAAYLVVDVDDLITRFQQRGMNIDLQELAVGLRGGAALASGLISADKLRAIAVADWQRYENQHVMPNPKVIFQAAGYDVFDIPLRESMADVLIIHYFSYDPDPIDELILATTSRDLLPLIRRIKVTRSARIRMWGSEDVLQGTEFADEIIFQPLETLLGIQSKNVSVFIDFENIAISLNEQGFVVNLDTLIESLVSRAQSHGQVVKMSAYAPWGQRGTLPPLVDNGGREITDDAPSRLMIANIDPVFTLPGKNSADVRIVKEILVDVTFPDAADIYILASGDRDFNDVINAVVQRGASVILWGVRGSTSRVLEQHPSLSIEYIEDFTNLQTHQSLGETHTILDEAEPFVPSQWSSVVIQFDLVAERINSSEIYTNQLLQQLYQVGVVVSLERGEDLLSQAQSVGFLRLLNNEGLLALNESHPIVDNTRIIMHCIRRRVANTLKVRNWEYVNYGFLLQGLEMERELERPGFNNNDQWRSHWIDSLVREGVLERKLLPHRHNPDDLVPVIRLPDGEIDKHFEPSESTIPEITDENWSNVSMSTFAEMDAVASQMAIRIIVSIEQFTSFRNFAWCPLGSLHRRLRDFDMGVAFQRSVEYLEANGIVSVDEYPNPQSNFHTKGISLNVDAPLAKQTLTERNELIRALLKMYEQNTPISTKLITQTLPNLVWDVDLWVSIMETENVLNVLQSRQGQYSLFRTHHTVKIVAGDIGQ